MIEIKNIRSSKPTKPYDFYIDRRSPIGNPFHMKTESMRAGACNQYEAYFKDQIKNTSTPFYNYLDDIQFAHHKYNRVRLFCWCAPKRCHGETIKKWLESFQKDE